jgi:glycopeptide antibiotics resistance protein
MGIIKLRMKRFFKNLFWTYFFTLVYLTLFTFNYYRYGKSFNLVIFDSIKLMLASQDPILIFKNIIGNLLLFFPFGLFLPLINKRLRQGWRLVGLAFLTSLLIELCQYHYAERIFDVDDLLLNTVGAGLGWGGFKLVHLVWNWYEKGIKKE